MEYDRFSSSFSDFTFINNKEEEVSLEECLKNKEKNVDSISIGDIVKLKNVDYHVTVTNTNFDAYGVGIVKYAGKKTNDDSKNLILFDSKDIDYKIHNTKIKN